MGERQTTGGHTTVSLSDMRANSHCESTFFGASLGPVPNPCVVLFSSEAAADLALQKTEVVLSEFPQVRVFAVTVGGGRGSGRSGAASSPLRSGALPRRYVGIYAATRVDDWVGFLRLVSPNPLIFVPVADDPESGLRLLREAVGCGAPTVALGEAGARNAALLAISMWAAGSGADKLRKQLDGFRRRQTTAVRKMKLPAI